MPTFAELVENVDQLSMNEMREMREILDKRLVEKRRQEILDASEQAMKDYEEGKTISLNSPEEMKKFFNDLLNDND